ncbi:hypothetical protein SPF06_11770 [Sinomonas sp. JGH33]|uniref:Uncharacterized protein n=1 Tax=Sinomonas terricola TaxID=3110330 RepID=A0ABU5T6V2_9MICC|nr:hypothetical protein [Sinomonas sp. JGH33]MEA5455400.1 hypothetical protein [Sinomonas sp. JGH33]
MKFHGLNDPHPGVHFEAPRGFTTDAGDRIQGDLYRGQNGYLFTDATGARWWVMFSAHGSNGDAVSQRTGRIVACSEPDEDQTFDVRVLADDVHEDEAAEAFLKSPPASLEEAVSLAATLRKDEG